METTEKTISIKDVIKQALENYQPNLEIPLEERLMKIEKSHIVIGLYIDHLFGFCNMLRDSLNQDAQDKEEEPNV